MAQQTINIGTSANDGTGDPLRDALDKANDNFTELYTDKAPLDSPALTGTPTAPTPAPNDNSTQIATTAYVDAAVGAVAGGTPVTTQAGTSYTFDADDANSLVRFTSGSAVTATVPTNASVAYAVGTTIAIEQAGAGAVEVEGDTGVTVNPPPGGTLTTAGQYAMVQIIKVDDDEWTLYGLVEAAS